MDQRIDHEEVYLARLLIALMKWLLPIANKIFNLLIQTTTTIVVLRTASWQIFLFIDGTQYYEKS